KSRFLRRRCRYQRPFGLQHDAGDAWRLGSFLVDGCIRVANRPQIVRADRFAVVVALSLWIERDIHRRVVHYRESEPMTVRIGRVIEPFEWDAGRSLEVVPQAERVSDLVHNELPKRVLDVFLGKWLAGRENAKPGQKRILDAEL